MRSILDKDFVYTPSHATDIRRTFAKVRREQQKRDATLLPKASVAQIKQRVKA